MDPVLHVPNEITVVDNFFENPDEVRSAALEDNDFAPAEHKGHRYQGVGPVSRSGFWERVEAAVRFPVLPASYDGNDATFFRLGLAGDESTTWIHPDTGMDASWAAICYLSEPPSPEYGTAFWHHPRLGGRLPEEARGDARLLSELDRVGQDQRYWNPAGIVFQRYNRFVAYPSAKFHSRWPKYPVGNSEEDGRLIRVWFFSKMEGSEWLSPPPP